MAKFLNCCSTFMYLYLSKFVLLGLFKMEACATTQKVTTQSAASRILSLPCNADIVIAISAVERADTSAAQHASYVLIME